MSENFSLNCATIILAAGSSSRMGRPKQLISIDGETLVQKTVGTAIQVGSSQTIAVVGANRESVEKSLKGFGIELIYNPNWEKGIGNSLKRGLSFLMTRFPEIEAALFLVCDQPLLTTKHLRKILKEFEQTKSPIVASFYSGKNGVPVLFHKSLFQQLLAIDDKYGAKKIMEKNSALVKSIDFPNGEVDLDTPEDLQKFKNTGF